MSKFSPAKKVCDIEISGTDEDEYAGWTVSFDTDAQCEGTTDEFETAGDALNFALKWCADRGLQMQWGPFTAIKPGSLLEP